MKYLFQLNFLSFIAALEKRPDTLQGHFIIPDKNKFWDPHFYYGPKKTPYKEYRF